MATALLTPTRHDVYPFIDPRGRLEGAARGKSVLVTGAGTGIGKSIAESFAIAGASELVLAARRTALLEQTKTDISSLAPDCRVTVVGEMDISDPESVEGLFGSLRSAPDVLVSNAAVSLEWSAVAESDADRWCRNIDVNLKGTYLMARRYLNAVRASGGKEGRIINVSSNASWRYIEGLSSYAASKAGVNLLSEFIDRESREAGGGVRCVAMHPGGVVTEIPTKFLSEDMKKFLIDKPALPGAVAVYLSTERSDFLMGRFVSATWDMEELEKQKEKIEKDQHLLTERVVGMF